MKKIFMALASFMASAVIFAYNPPVSGQNLYTLSSPTQLTSASSSAGSGLFIPGPDSIAFNPALTSFEQRVQLDFDFSVLAATASENDDAMNYAVQTGILIPTKMFVFSGIMNGVFCDAYEMYLADTLNFRAGLSKEISERLSVGMNLSGGLLWDAGNDWSLGADLGVLYRREHLKFLKDFRIGVAALNLGKTYSPDAQKMPGIDEDKEVDSFPSLVTMRGGIAARFLDTNQFKGGFSFDAATPAFQNMIFNAGLQFCFRDVVYLSVSENLDVEELKNGHYDLMPAIGLSFKINLNAKNNSYLKARDWDSSEMLASLAWQQKYETLQAVSGGARLYLGMKDTQAPVIQLWNGEDDQ